MRAQVLQARRAVEQLSIMLIVLDEQCHAIHILELPQGCTERNAQQPADALRSQSQATWRRIVRFTPFFRLAGDFATPRIC